MTLSLPGRARLKKRREFLRVREQGRKAQSRHLLVVYAPSDQLRSRIGLAVTKKVEPSSVKRNRIKRVLREVFRLNQYRLRGNFDIVIIARAGLEAMQYKLIEAEVLSLFRREKLIAESAA